MKPFQLDTILTFRKRLEDIANNHLVEANKEKESVQQKLNIRLNNLADIIKEKERLQQNTVPISELIDYENRILYCENDIQGIKKKLAGIIKSSKKKQLDLIEKSRDRQIMEKLKHQKNMAWRHYLEKKETTQLDEIATLRHNRRR